MNECRGKFVPSCAEPRACIGLQITGMLLEMAESEIMALLENQLACRDKVHT